MTMTLADGFKLLRHRDRLNPEPALRLYFWHGSVSVLLLGKAKVANADILAALGGMPPRPPYCTGRMGLYNRKGERGHELRVVVSGALTGTLVKDLRQMLPKHDLHGVNVVIEKGAHEDGEALAHQAADRVTKGNGLALHERVTGLAARRPELKGVLREWLQSKTEKELDGMSSDDLARMLGELAKIEAHGLDNGEDRTEFDAKVTQAASRARDRQPREGAKIAELVRRALGFHHANRLADARKELDRLNAMWDTGAVRGSGGPAFEQELLTAAQDARVSHPNEAARIAELVQRSRDQHGRGTPDSLKSAKQALAELQLFGGASATISAARRAAVAALATLRRNVNRSIEKGSLPRSPSGRNTTTIGTLGEKAAQAEQLIKGNDFEAALTLVAEAESLLRDAENRFSESLGRQEAQVRQQQAAQQHQKVKGHLDKLAGKRDGIAADYAEGRVFGKGANGKVSELVSRTGGPPLAMKTPLGDAELFDHVLEDLQHEAEVARAVGPHPNIAQVYGMAKIGGQQRLLLERIDGADMGALNSSLLEKRRLGKLTEEQYWGAVQFTFQRTLEALDFVAQKGYVHGDIKPENIMIDAQSGEPKLIDFGSMNAIGTRRGFDTPVYAAPEPGKHAATPQDAFPVGASSYEIGRGNTGKPDDRAHRFDFGTSNPDALTNRRWAASNRTNADDPDSIPQDWRALASPALALGDNRDPNRRAFDTTTTVDPSTGRPTQSSVEKKKGIYAADTAYVDFVNQLMHPDPRYRLTPGQALAHPFMKQRMLPDDEARALIKNVVAPPTVTPAPQDKQIAALREVTDAARKLAADAHERALQVDKVSQAVQAELFAAQAGRRFTQNPLLTEDKLAKLHKDTAERLGVLAETIQKLTNQVRAYQDPNKRASAKAVPASADAKAEAKQKIHDDTMAQAKDAEQARRVLAGAAAKLDSAWAKWRGEQRVK